MKRALQSTWENTRLAFETLLANRYRSFLTALGIFIGVKVGGVNLAGRAGQGLEVRVVPPRPCSPPPGPPLYAISDVCARPRGRGDFTLLWQFS